MIIIINININNNLTFSSMIQRLYREELYTAFTYPLSLNQWNLHVYCLY